MLIAPITQCFSLVSHRTMGIIPIYRMIGHIENSIKCLDLKQTHRNGILRRIKIAKKKGLGLIIKNANGYGMRLLNIIGCCINCPCR